MKNFKPDCCFANFIPLLFLALIFFSSVSALAQNDSLKLKARKNRVAIITNAINHDPFIGTYSEIGLSHEGHITGTSSVSFHATYLVNNVAKGLVIRPEIRFYLKKYAVTDQGFYISLGAAFSYIKGNGLPDANAPGQVNLYRLGLTVGTGYQHTFSNRIFINAGIITGLATGLYQADGLNTPSNIWYSENKTHPLFSQLTAIFRVGYLF